MLRCVAILGIEPDPYTLRELSEMARVKMELMTWPVAQIQCQLDNMLKDPKKHKYSRPIDFNPWAKRNREKPKVDYTVNGTQLANMLLGRKKAKPK